MSVSNKQNMLVQSLEHFFTRKKKHQENMRDFLELVQKGAKISLRIIDWFVTNYSRENDIIIINPSAPNPNSSSSIFNVHESYKLQLKAYSKRQFDPFCRRKRINFHYEDKSSGENKIMKIKTTVGQLNFFRWAIENSIIQYIREHITEIEESMRNYVRLQREEKRKLKSHIEKEKEKNTKSKTRRLSNVEPHPKESNQNSKTLRKGTIVTNHTHTTVFFS